MHSTRVQGSEQAENSNKEQRWGKEEVNNPYEAVQLTQAKVSILCIGHEKKYVYTEHLRRLSDSFLLRRSMSELEIPHVLVTGHRQSFVCRYAFELARSD